MNGEEWVSQHKVKSMVYYLRCSIRMFKKHAKARQRFINTIDNGEWNKLNISKEQQEHARNIYRKEIRYDMSVIKDSTKRIETLELN